MGSAAKATSLIRYDLCLLLGKFNDLYSHNLFKPLIKSLSALCPYYRRARNCYGCADIVYKKGSSVTLVAVVRHEIELAAIEEDACAIVVEVAKASGG